MSQICNYHIKKAVLGIEIGKYDSYCCILVDGQVISCLREAYFCSYSMYSVPINAIKACLKESSIHINEIDQIVLCLELKSNNTIPGTDMKYKDIERNFRLKFHYYGPIMHFDKSILTAKISFYYSRYSKSDILILHRDHVYMNIGFGYGENQKVNHYENKYYIHPFAIVYELIKIYTGYDKSLPDHDFLRLGRNGKSIYLTQIRDIYSEVEYWIAHDPDTVPTNNFYDNFKKRLQEILGFMSGNKWNNMEQCYINLINSLAVFKEEYIESKINLLLSHSKTGSICLGGNLLFNENNAHIVNKYYHRFYMISNVDHYICAFGAAILGSLQIGLYKLPLYGKWKESSALSNNKKKILHIMEQTDLTYHDFAGKDEEYFKLITSALKKGKLVGWFQGSFQREEAYSMGRMILGNPQTNNLFNALHKVLKRNAYAIPTIYLSASCKKEGVHFISEERFPVLHKLLINCSKNIGCEILAAVPLFPKKFFNQDELYHAIKEFIICKLYLLIVDDIILMENENKKPSISWLRIQMNEMEKTTKFEYSLEEIK